MNPLKRLFCISEESQVPPMPSWEEIVELLYDKDLNRFAHEVVEVLYSRERDRRYVILKRESGVYSYILQKICVEDPEEWERLHSLGLWKCDTPAWWEEDDTSWGKSFFKTMEELWKELKAEATYCSFFAACRSMEPFDLVETV